MTDSIPPWNVEEIFPDGADPVDAALAQLREPHHLLAEALTTFRAAQAVSRDLDVRPDDPSADEYDGRHERHRRLIDETSELTRIAEVAAQMMTTTYPVPTVEETDDPGRSPVDYDAPQPVQANFRAVIVGIPLGRCGGRAWVWVEDAGFIDVTDGVEDASDDFGVGYTLSGRVAAMTGRHILGIQGSGTPICLPRTLVMLEPDE